MTTNNDALREMLAFLNGEGPLDGVYFGERHPTENGVYWWRKRLSVLTSLAARKPEPHPDEFVCPLCFDDPANIKPEPQAQAGEPEVVAYRTRLHRMRGAEYWGFNERNPFPGLPNSGEPLITLQSHREAMAKKDAALRACAEALENLNALVWGECPSLLNEDSGGNSKFAIEIDDAITQAKEVLK